LKRRYDFLELPLERGYYSLCLRIVLFYGHDVGEYRTARSRTPLFHTDVNRPPCLFWQRALTVERHAPSLAETSHRSRPDLNDVGPRRGPDVGPLMV
jgi:hypothetical protein